jgi:hypothetical protein
VFRTKLRVNPQQYLRATSKAVSNWGITPGICARFRNAATEIKKCHLNFAPKDLELAGYEKPYMPSQARRIYPGFKNLARGDRLGVFAHERAEVQDDRTSDECHRRWHCGQKYVDRCPCTMRRIGVVQIKHGSPSRSYTRVIVS